MMVKVSILCCFVVLFSHHNEVSGTITQITPAGVILSGGLSVTVTGTDLNVGTTTPKIVITANYSGSTFPFTGEDCTVVEATSLTCPSPAIDTSTITGYTVPTDPKKWLLDVDSSGDPISFTIGVTWSTGSEDYGSVNVYKDPELTMQYPQRTFTVWTNSIIRFSGYDLTGFISNMSDYKFTIAHLDCPVSYVNETWISCTVPTTIPDVINYQDHSPVNMSIGNYQQQGFGQVHYRVPIFTDATDTYIDFDPSDLANRVTAMGHYLMVGLNHSSYRVQIGVGECSDVVVSTEMLTCRPPGTAPAPLAAFPLMGQLPQMVITVPKDSSEAVFQYTYHVTYIKYGNTTDENQPGLPSNGQVTAPNSNDDADDEPKVPGNDTSDSWKWIVVGVCAFVGVAFLTVLFCCLCCSDLCPIGKQRMRWVEKEPFYKVDTDSTRTPRSSIRSYQTRTSSGMYPTPSHLYYITQGQERL